jgi:hypothetical protein
MNTATITAGDYTSLNDVLRTASSRLSDSPDSARTAAAEAVAHLRQQQDGVITGPQLAMICHAAQAAAHTARPESTDIADGLDIPDVIDDDRIRRTRATMMAALTDAVAAHEQAADHLGSLRGALCDPDLTYSRDGHDLAAHIDTAIRSGRAAYAVLHAITTA